MNLTRPLFYLAVAAAMVSSLATHVHAQASPESILACELFDAEVAARDNIVVVSGIQVEEASTVPVEDRDPDAFSQTIQFLEVETPILTIPSGTFQNTAGALASLRTPRPVGDSYGVGRVVSSLRDGEGEALVLDGVGRTIYEPNAELGRAVGFCISLTFAESDFLFSVFDGDTFLGEVSSESPSFFVEPGQTFTRIQSPIIGVLDIRVAFEQPDRSADSIIDSVVESLIDLGDVADNDVVNAIKSLGQAEKQLDRGNENSACAHINNAIRRIERSDLSDAVIAQLVAELEQAKASLEVTQ